MIVSNSLCLQYLETLDLSNNNLDQIPTLFLSKIPNLKDLFLQNNNVMSLDFTLLVLVWGQVNLSGNQISKVSNTANTNLSSYSRVRVNSINLSNNSPILDLNDTIYEMYGACGEVPTSNQTLSTIPIVTLGMAKINFNGSTMNCSCNQYYLQQRIKSAFPIDSFGVTPPPNLQCSGGILFYNSNATSVCSNSSAAFRTIQPRLCKIQPDTGSLVSWNVTDTTAGVSCHPKRKRSFLRQRRSSRSIPTI